MYVRARVRVCAALNRFAVGSILHLLLYYTLIILLRSLIDKNSDYIIVYYKIIYLYYNIYDIPT